MLEASKVVLRVAVAEEGQEGRGGGIGDYEQSNDKVIHERVEQASRL